MMRYCVPVVLMAAALTCGAETDTQRGKRVVDEAVDALGGENFLAMRDRTETGRAYSFYREQLSGLSVATIYTRYRAVPGGKLEIEEREAFGKNQESAILFTAKGEGFELTYRGARPLPDERLARYYDTTMHNVFYILHTRLHEKGMTFESKGADVIDNMPVEIVDLIDANNEVTTVYFHKSTKLPIRQVFTRRNPVTKEKDEEVTLFSKYRNVDGVQWPFAVQRERNGEKIFELYADSVTVNQALEDRLFEIPAGMKRLKPVQ